MDQVRAIVSVLWRERFWVLTIIGMIVAVGCWYLSASDLDKQFASRKSQIDGKFSSTSNLSREPDHPNENVIEGNKVEARKERDNVLAIWRRLYDEQREKVLKWPADSLKPEFIQTIEGLKFRDPFPSYLEQNMRAEYANYIGTRLDDLLKIVEALKIEGRGSRGEGGRASFSRSRESSPYEGRGRGTEEVEEEDYIVEWLDQGNLRSKLDFEDRKPTSLEIWVTQEDLWVYETLLHVIASTNNEKGASRPGNAAVKTIITLEVGREAAMASRQTSQIIMPSSANTGGGFGERGESEYSQRGGPMMERGMEGAFGEGAEIDDSLVLAGRYLQADGEPYEGEPEDPEFRRLPIHMHLEMDQRWLPNLMVHCANATLPVEVTQVKVNPEQSGGDFGSGSSRGGRSARRGSVEGGSRRRQSTTTPSANPNLAEVDIQGVVYIYNEPDDAVLSLPGLDEPGEDGDQLAGDI